MTDIQNDAFANACANLGEKFDEYLIIARPTKHEILIHSSDVTWALGAVRRFILVQSRSDIKNDSRGDI